MYKKIDVEPVEKANVDRSEKFIPKIKISEINSYLMCFYDGRDISSYPNWVKTNLDMNLGLSCYVIHKNGKGIIFDTMLYSEQSEWIDNYLKEHNIEIITVINSHGDPDHIAGNYLYKNKTIISSTNTKRCIEAYKISMQSGDEWRYYGDPNFPEMKELVLPNCVFDDKMVLYLEDIRIELYEVFLHRLGSTIIYLPQDKIMLAGDIVEDTIIFLPKGAEYFIPIKVLTYDKIYKMDISKIFPSHGRFEIIDNGGYSKEFILAMKDYKSQLITRMREPNFLELQLEDFIGKWVEKGILNIHEPYRWLHKYNLKNVYDFYRDMPTPIIPSL